MRIAMQAFLVAALVVAPAMCFPFRATTSLVAAWGPHAGQPPRIGRASAQAAPIQPKTIEVHYDEDGTVIRTSDISQTVKADERDRIHRPSRSMKSIGVNEVGRQVRQRFGKATLVVLYASYCSPCREFMPTVARLANKWREDGLSVVTFSLDPDPLKFRRYASRFRGDFELLRIRPYPRKSLSRQATALGMSVIKSSFAIPAFAVFDHKGQVVAENAGGAAPFRALDAIVGQLVGG